MCQYGPKKWQEDIVGYIFIYNQSSEPLKTTSQPCHPCGTKIGHAWSFMYETLLKKTEMGLHKVTNCG